MKTKKQKNRYRPAVTKKLFNAYFLESDDIVVAFVDLETEGLDKNIHGITQAAMRKYRYRDFALTDCQVFNIYINHHRPLDPEIVKKTHITDEMLETEGIDEDEAFFSIQEFLEDVDVFVGYNERFDYEFLEVLYNKYGDVFPTNKRFDVMQMLVDLYSIYDVPGHRALSTFAKALGAISDTSKLHNAEEDVRVTVSLFNRVFHDYVDYPEPDETPGKPVPVIKSHWFWSNPKKPLMKRIYFATSCGKLFYEMIDRSFGCDVKENAYSVEELDMEAFINSVLNRFHMESVEDLSHIKFETKGDAN